LRTGRPHQRDVPRSRRRTHPGGEPILVPGSDFNYLDPDESVEIATSLMPTREKGKDLFALEVHGNSMVDAMVNDGDIVVMKPAQDARNGDMVAVWLPERSETTLKYFFKEKDRYRLQPANPTMKPIYVDKSDPLEIKGKVVMVIRKVESCLARRQPKKEPGSMEPGSCSI
jgi:repressor LexA